MTANRMPIIPSAMSLFDRPEAVQGEAITEDIVNELTAGITDELVADASLMLWNKKV